MTEEKFEDIKMVVRSRK